MGYLSPLVTKGCGPLFEFSRFLFCGSLILILGILGMVIPSCGGRSNSLYDIVWRSTLFYTYQVAVEISSYTDRSATLFHIHKGYVWGI